MDGMNCTANKNTAMHLQIEKGVSVKKRYYDLYKHMWQQHSKAIEG